MPYDRLYRASGAAALAGGLLRILVSFPLIQNPTTLEWIYSATDVLLLLGVMGIYLWRAPKLGFLGFTSFAVAVASLSFIGGPDADPFGFSTYQQGAAALAIAMVGMSLAWMRAGEQPLLAPALWFLSVIAAGLLGALPAPLPSYGFPAAGTLFGAAFAAAGWSLMQSASAQPGDASGAIAR